MSSQLSFFKVNSFIVQFKDQKTLELMVTSANIPGFTLGEIEIGRPVVKDKRPGDSLTYNDLSITVLCDEKLAAYKEIYEYLILSANPNTGDLEISDNVFDCSVQLLTNKNNYQHKIYFYNAFIKSISDIQLETTTTEGEAATFTVDLGFSFFNFID